MNTEYKIIKNQNQHKNLLYKFVKMKEQFKTKRELMQNKLDKITNRIKKLESKLLKK